MARTATTQATTLKSDATLAFSLKPTPNSLVAPAGDWVGAPMIHPDYPHSSEDEYGVADGVEYQGFLDPAASNGLAGEAKPTRTRRAATPATLEPAPAEEAKPTRVARGRRATAAAEA